MKKVFLIIFLLSNFLVTTKPQYKIRDELISGEREIATKPCENDSDCGPGGVCIHPFIGESYCSYE